MEGGQARTYFELYKALVAAAYIQHDGRERSYALLRAWSYYASPLIDTFWYEDENPVAVETAHHLMGWLWWLKRLDEPEQHFRHMYEESKNQNRIGWRNFEARSNPRTDGAR
jgi:hypothetical protein